MAGRTRAILVVEGDPMLADNMDYFQEERGHKLVHCANALDAWDSCLEQELPLLVLDWVLPGDSGVELRRKLRADKRFQHALVVMVTRKHGAEDLAVALEAGVDDFSMKPVEWTGMEIRMTVAERRAALRQADDAKQPKIKAYPQVGEAITAQFAGLQVSSGKP